MTVLSSSACVDVKLGKEELKFLELRQQLKKSIRKQMKKGSDSLCDGSLENKKRPNDNYGSFFGRSQPSIAPRVIRETRFMLEAKPSAAKLINSAVPKADVLAQGMKAHELKAARDYSFIFSDDAETLTSVCASMANAIHQHPSSVVPGAKSDSTRKKDCDERKKMAKLMRDQLQPAKSKVPDEHKFFSSELQPITSMDQEKMFLEPCTAKVMIKQVKSIKKRVPGEKNDFVGSMEAKVVQKKLPKCQASDMHEVHCLSKCKSVTEKQLEQKKEVCEPKKLDLICRKIESSSQPKGLNGSTRASLIIRLKIPPELRTGKKKEECKQKNEELITIQKKSLSKHHLKKVPEHNLCDNNEVDKDYISSLCQSLFRRNYSKHVQDDYDDTVDCMVASFADIQREERKSAKIGRREDKMEQLRIEKEEREEMLRRRAKRQKSHRS